ncbi:MAG: CARDB domain-containing protein [Thermoplasmata archaeon]
MDEGSARRSLWIVSALLLPALLNVTPPAGGTNITIPVTAFGGGQSEATLAFPAAGSSQALNLSLQTGLRVLSARLNVSGLPFTDGGTDCPLSPYIDLGADGSAEWRFEGTGYGSLGHQSLFSNGSAVFRIPFPSAGSNSSMAVRLPAGASLRSFRMDVEPSGFSGPSISVSLDVGADGVAEWSQSLSGRQTIADLESAAASYMALATPSVDAFGVRSVAVPLRVVCGGACTLTFTNLSIPYDCVIESCDMGGALDLLLPDEQGAWNSSVSIRVGVSSAGRVRLSGVRILAQPPHHAPELLDAEPAQDPELPENSSVRFSVSPRDIYGNPIALQWYLDASPVPGATAPEFIYFADFNSSGRHVVTVVADNGLSQASRTWQVTVRDVNRAPVIQSFSPFGEVLVPENSTQEFSVSASDPDGGELSYEWLVAGELKAEETDSFIFAPGFRTAGEWSIEARVIDVGGLCATVAWRVRVTRTNVPPVILSRSPAEDPEVDEGGSLNFTIQAEEVNGDALSYSWFLDGVLAGSESWFNYTPDYFSAGARELRALVSDGEFTTVTRWSVTVRDVNRAPRAVIDGAHEGAEFLETDTVSLSALRSFDPDLDRLGFSWFIGDRSAGSGPWLNTTLPRGNQTIRLVVDDGRGGSDEARVNLTVRSSRLEVAVSLSSKHPVEGDRIKVVVTVTGAGDAAAENIFLAFFVDGEPLAGRTIPVVQPGHRYREVFGWRAEPGKHELLVTAGNETMITYVSVARGIPGWFLPVSLTLFAMAVVVGATAFYVYRKAIKIWASGVIPWWKAMEEEKDEEERREEEKRKARLSLDEIRLDHTPYKGRELKIETTIPEEPSPGERIEEELTLRRRRVLRPLNLRPAPAARPATPVTAPTAEGPAPESGGGAPEGTEMAVVAPAPAGANAAKGEAPAGGPAPSGEAPPARRLRIRVPGSEAPSITPIPRKPKRRMSAIEDRIHALERKGVDVTQPRRLLSLAKSFWKGGNPKKADQYLQRAEEKLAELEESHTAEVGAEKPKGEACPKCGARMEPGWIVCPECEARIR